MAVPPLRLISFDLDDTILDSEARSPARLAAAVEALRAAGLRRTAEAWEAAMAAAHAADPALGGRFAPLLAALGLDPAAADPAIRAAREAYEAALFDELAPFPDAEEVLARLKPHYRIAVTTNGPAALQRRKLRCSGVEHLLDAAIVSGEVGVWKPDPAIFALTCAAAGVPPHEAAHVGDALSTDVRGARAAGLYAVWKRPRPDATSGGHDGVEPDAVIDSLSDILPLLLGGVLD